MRCARKAFANLREFVRFWADEGKSAACCLLVDSETLETDSQEFDCEACPVAEALDGLWPENRRAWSVYKRIASRFLFDGHAVSVALERHLSDLEMDAALDLIDRLALIYTELTPLPQTRD